MASRPFTSGLSTTICRSNRPGRSSAGSSTSGRFVAAMMMTPLRESNPSISASSWFSVCSRSSWLPIGLCDRTLPSASSSSMNTMHGALASACWKRSRMRAAPTPTNISTNSEPLRLKNGTCASPATARASSVLPVPGGPTAGRPRNPPAEVQGVFRNSTISHSFRPRRRPRRREPHPLHRPRRSRAAARGHDAAPGTSHPAEEPPQGHDQHRDDPPQQVRHPAVHGLARELHTLGLEPWRASIPSGDGKQRAAFLSFQPWASAFRAAIARRSSLRHSPLRTSA